MPSAPSEPSLRAISSGNSASSNQRAMFGRISRSTNSATRLRWFSSSALSNESIASRSDASVTLGASSDGALGVGEHRLDLFDRERRNRLRADWVQHVASYRVGEGCEQIDRV